jgi:trehalose-6-phosphate synthase
MWDLPKLTRLLKSLCQYTFITLDNPTVDEHFHAAQVQALDRAVQDWLRRYYADHPDREPGA